MTLEQWESRFEEKISGIASTDDPAHDLLHFKRVVATAKRLCELENGSLEIVVPAAWLHDIVIVPKDSLLRSKASQMSAQKAVEFLSEIDYPARYLDQIFHAIEGHSFSANIEVKTLEAKIVQDADRLDALGAIGIARCFATAGLMKRAFYSAEDPFCKSRLPDDSQYTIDHFLKKLFVTADNMKTKSGRNEAQKRVVAMKNYLVLLEAEIAR